jgi:hypothetical protein
MTQPEAHAEHDPTHAHVDLDALMDGSSTGPSAAAGDPEVDTSRGAGGDGEEADRTGEASDAYMTGQDDGSIA